MIFVFQMVPVFRKTIEVANGTWLNKKMEPSYYISTDGGKSNAGPYSMPQIRAMWKSGVITANSLIYDEMLGWKKLELQEAASGISVRKVILVIFCILFAGFVVLFIASQNEPIDTRYDFVLNRRDEAWQFGTQCVSRVLKSPATAIFSDRSVSELSYNSYEITGNVDSQNGFGALIRNNWKCLVHIDDQSKIWHLDYMRVGDLTVGKNTTASP